MSFIVDEFQNQLTSNIVYIESQRKCKNNILKRFYHVKYDSQHFHLEIVFFCKQTLALSAASKRERNVPIYMNWHDLQNTVLLERISQLMRVEDYHSYLTVVS